MVHLETHVKILQDQHILKGLGNRKISLKKFGRDSIGQTSILPRILRSSRVRRLNTVMWTESASNPVICVSKNVTWCSTTLSLCREINILTIYFTSDIYIWKGRIHRHFQMPGSMFRLRRCQQLGLNPFGTELKASLCGHK